MSTLAVNNITDTTGLLAPVFPAGSAQLNPLANREDKVINGDFGVWQRGVTGTANDCVADRWINEGIGGTVTQSRQAFALGDTLGATQPRFFLRNTVSGQTLATQYGLVAQQLESVRSYAGQTITVLGWARRSSGSTGNMAVECAQFFGAGGVGVSPPVTAISTTTVALGSTWAPFATVMTIPTVFGKTLGTDGNDALVVYFWTSAGSDWNFRTNSLGLQAIGVDLWGIHIRQGTWTAAATADYRPRDPGTELALCQRFYEICQVVVIPTASTITVPYKVTKRVSPSLATTFDAGTGATYLGLGTGIHSCFQNVGHSQIATATVRADAEL